MTAPRERTGSMPAAEASPSATDGSAASRATPTTGPHHRAVPPTSTATKSWSDSKGE